LQLDKQKMMPMQMRRLKEMPKLLLIQPLQKQKQPMRELLHLKKLKLKLRPDVMELQKL